ncbi:MAG TPA: 1-acyl-sn-glycerol-3-phosphate acyltransferase, partial [Bacteroidia bacterium]
KIFFRRSQGGNLQNLRGEQPILIALNHPNAFMDPIALSCILVHPRTFYMARGDAFKKGIVSTILTATGIIPIFRMRDAGIEGVKKNNESFSIAYRIWNKNHKIMVFAEGLCIQERRLRPIQKGTARMAFGFMEEFKRQDFLIVPVSLNYSHPDQFDSDIYCNVGQPIAVKDYLPLYHENSAKAVNELTRTLEAKMKELTPHLEHKDNDEVIEQLQDICKHQFLTENKLDRNDLSDHHKYWDYITKQLNMVTNESPEKAEQLRKTTKTYSEKLKELGICDENVYNCSKVMTAGLGLWLMLIAGLPVYVIGKALNFVPWICSHAIARKTAKNIEFFTSVNYVTGAFISLFYLAAELIILWCIFGVWWYLPAYAVLKIMLGLMAVKYSRFKKLALGCIRISSLEKRNATLFNELVALRKDILSNLTANSALLIRQ